MKCERIQQLWPAFQGKTLDTALEAAFQEHLERCAACRAEGALFSATWRILAAMPVIAPSTTFRARFWARVRREGETDREKRLFPRGRWVPMAAGLLATWILSVIGGVALYEARSKRNGTTTADALRVFTAPYPLNSIEAAYLGSGPEEKNQP